MKSLDTLVTGGEIITAHSRFAGSIGIRDGKIAGIYAPGDEPEAREVISADGKTIMPGVVDSHSHHREPGFTHKEDIETATRACAAGGVTTTVAMPNVYPPPIDLERLEDMFGLYRQKAIVDWNINPAGTQLDEIPRMAATGVTAMKIFMVVDTGRDYPHMPGIGVHEHGKLMAIMEACAAADIPLMIHPHDQSLMTHIEEAFWARGERDALAYARAYAAHDGLIWESAIALLLRLQKATGVHLHVLHIQTGCSWATTGRTSNASARTLSPTGCPSTTRRRCGTASTTAPSTSLPPTMRLTPARRRRWVGRTAGRHTPVPRPPSSI